MMAEIPSALCLLTFASFASLVLGTLKCIGEKGKQYSLPSQSSGRWGDGHGSNGQWHMESRLSALIQFHCGLFHPKLLSDTHTS